MFSRSSKKLLKGGQNNGGKSHPGSSVSHGLGIESESRGWSDRYFDLDPLTRKRTADNPRFGDYRRFLLY